MDLDRPVYTCDFIFEAWEFWMADYRELVMKHIRKELYGIYPQSTIKWKIRQIGPIIKLTGTIRATL